MALFSTSSREPHRNTRGSCVSRADSNRGLPVAGTRHSQPPSDVSFRHWPAARTPTPQLIFFHGIYPPLSDIFYLLTYLFDSPQQNVNPTRAGLCLICCFYCCVSCPKITSGTFCNFSILIMNAVKIDRCNLDQEKFLGVLNNFQKCKGFLKLEA